MEVFTSFKNCTSVASHIKEQRDFIHDALHVRDKVLAHYLFVFVWKLYPQGMFEGVSSLILQMNSSPTTTRNPSPNKKKTHTHTHTNFWHQNWHLPFFMCWMVFSFNNRFWLKSKVSNFHTKKMTRFKTEKNTFTHVSFS